MPYTKLGSKIIKTSQKWSLFQNRAKSGGVDDNLGKLGDKKW